MCGTQYCTNFDMSLSIYLATIPTCAQHVNGNSSDGWKPPPGIRNFDEPLAAFVPQLGHGITMGAWVLQIAFHMVDIVEDFTPFS